MKWTKMPPTKPGWYWRKYETKYIDDIIKVYVSKKRIMGKIKVEKMVKWMGPVNVPPYQNRKNNGRKHD